MAGTCLAAGEVHEESLALCQCLLYYGEGPLKDQSNGAAIVSRMLGPLQRVLRLVRRCEVVLGTALDQLAALTNSLETKSGMFASAPPEMHFQPLIDCIADVLLSLITIQVHIFVRFSFQESLKTKINRRCYLGAHCCKLTGVCLKGL